MPDECPEETAPEDMEEEETAASGGGGLRPESRGFFCVRLRLAPRDYSCLRGAWEKKGAGLRVSRLPLF